MAAVVAAAVATVAAAALAAGAAAGAAAAAAGASTVAHHPCPSIPARRSLLLMVVLRRGRAAVPSPASMQAQRGVASACGGASGQPSDTALGGVSSPPAHLVVAARQQNASPRLAAAQARSSSSSCSQRSGCCCCCCVVLGCQWHHLIAQAAEQSLQDAFQALELVLCGGCRGASVGQLRVQVEHALLALLCTGAGCSKRLLQQLWQLLCCRHCDSQLVSGGSGGVRRRSEPAQRRLPC